MITFPNSLETFLKDYWQQKPLMIRNAFSQFHSPISAEELAGLSLEEEVESRIVVQHSETNYELKKGPFTEQDYGELPEENWTLLIQGVDRLIPEVHALLDEFDFIPRWRIDDIMISYAAKGGNVGPHFDHYDVFLLQAQGQRQWFLTSQDCNEENYIQGVDLRLMKTFKVEQDYVCQPGDLLYLPPKLGHHGVSLTDDCLTYSIGYRTYKGLELWDSFGDFLAEKNSFTDLYQDPDWKNTRPGEISDGACTQAQQLLQSVLNDEKQLKQWFGRFATQLDTNASEQLPDPLATDDLPSLETFMDAVRSSESLERDPVCRFAYFENPSDVLLYINGSEWQSLGADAELIKLICNQSVFDMSELEPLLNADGNQRLLFDLWSLQFIVIN